MDTSVFSVRLDTEILRRLKKAAANERKTVNGIINDLARDYVERANDDGEDNLKALSYAIGKHSSGGGNVMEMDLGEILEEKYKAGHL